MSRANDPAFPIDGSNAHQIAAVDTRGQGESAYIQRYNAVCRGLTIREQFAVLIMAQLQTDILNEPDSVIEETRAGRAQHAVAEANALIAELAKPVQP